MEKRGLQSVTIRGELSTQLHWWKSSLRRREGPSSFYWATEPDTRLFCSDASGEDGWGACALGLHVAGPWLPAWRQSAGQSSPHMLFKEVLPLVVTLLLAASSLRGSVVASTTDNAGMALTLNKMCCGCAESLKLLRPMADSLARYRVGLVADHVYRRFNQHCDDLSHALPFALCQRHVKPGRPYRSKSAIPFAILDLTSGECFTAYMLFPRVTFPSVGGVES